MQSISVLKSLCRDRTTRITQEISIRGYITANDVCGEFYKTIVVEDDTGGIEISIDGDRLYRTYRRLGIATINCCGLWIGQYGGTIQLGSEPSGDYPVDRISDRDARRHISVAEAVERRRPLDMTIDRLSARHIGRYIRLSGIRFETPGAAWCDSDPETGKPVTTDRTICDRSGRTLVVRTDRRCSYANEPLPEGYGSLCGILDRFNGTFQIRVADHEIEFRN